MSGEADGLVTELCRLALTRGRDVAADELPRGVLGPAHRADAGAGRCGGTPAGPRKPRRKLARALFNDLDSLPTPRYDDYFDTLAASPLEPTCGRAFRWNPRADAGGARPTSARSAG